MFLKISAWLENNKMAHWLIRHFLWIVCLIAGSWLLIFKFDFIDLLLMCVAMESLAVGLSGVALFAYTQFKFIDEDLKVSAPIITGVFIGVHLLLGLISIGYYLAQNVVFALKP